MNPATLWAFAMWLVLALFFAWDMRRRGTRGAAAGFPQAGPFTVERRKIPGGQVLLYGACEAAMIVFPVGGVIAFVCRAQVWQSSLYRGADAVAFAAPDSLAAGLVPAFIVGIGAAAFCLASLEPVFPEYARWRSLQALAAIKAKREGEAALRRAEQELRAEGAGAVEAHHRAEVRTMLWLNLLAWLGAAPMCILNVDRYMRVTPAGLAVNRFWSLAEELHPWGEFEKVSVRASYGVEAKGWRSGFTLESGSGEAFDLWPGRGPGALRAAELITVLDLALSKGVKPAFKEPEGLTPAHQAEYGRFLDHARARAAGL